MSRKYKHVLPHYLFASNKTWFVKYEALALLVKELRPKLQILKVFKVKVTR